jgi:antirestriction protein ArdC
MPKLTAPEREAKRSAELEHAREAVEALKTTEGWKRWLGLRRHFHGYSFANQLLIALQKPDATRVAGFRAWLRLGYCVRRGEEALRVWVPIPPSKSAIEEWECNGAIADERPRTRFKLGAVFDRAQVAPLPPPADPVPLDPPLRTVEGDDLAWVFPRLVELAGELNSGVVIERMPDGRGGYFEPATRRIALNKANPVNHQVKTLVHELSHALLRWDLELTDLELSYSEEELVVESIAYTVCGSFGLDTAGYSIPYLASWSERAGLETIERAARTIDQIAKRIEGCLEDPR